ncbi:MAG: radical SAM protein [Nanoarchaeota archaeon]|nr:radical SAM protein [Nanoarchaeota archaeon]
MLKQIEILKIELLSNGMKISPSAKEALTERGKRPITLAEYATTSGIPLKLKNDIWVNAPFLEDFCKKSNIVLDFNGDTYFVIWENKKYIAEPTPVPAYFDKKNKRGVPYINLGVTHTDRVRISPIEGCYFACKFCDLNLLPYKKKRISDLIEVIEVAVNDEILPAKHGIISGGTPRPEDRNYFTKVMKEIPKAVDIPMDAFVPPWANLDYIEKIYSFGLNEISINIEIWNEKIAKSIMPQKAVIGRDRYLKFIEKAVDTFGKEKVRSIILVGLEPMKDLFEGVENLAKIGCSPVLSPFRPSPKTPLAKWPSPTVKQLVDAYEGSKKIVKKYNIKLGPHCIPDHHNTLTFPDKSNYYYYF